MRWASLLISDKILRCLAPSAAQCAGLVASAEWFQLLALLEVVHAAAGLVGGSPVTALMQWAGRSNVLFGVIKSVPEVSAATWLAAAARNHTSCWRTALGAPLAAGPLLSCAPPRALCWPPPPAQLQGRITVGVLFAAWALSEVIRYPWYGATLAGRCPHWLTWLRCGCWECRRAQQ